MEQFNTEQLTQLLDAKRYDEARQMLDSFFAQPLSEDDKGAVAFNKAMVFIEANKELNREHLRRLRTLLDELNELEKTGSNEDTQRRIDQIRKEISEY